LNASITDLNNQLKAVTAERDLLKSNASTGDASREMAQQMETLRREKAEVELMLAEKAKPPVAEATDESASLIVCVHPIVVNVSLNFF
jgi:nucleoprotein TPR